MKNRFVVFRDEIDELPSSFYEPRVFRTLQEAMEYAESATWHYNMSIAELRPYLKLETKIVTKEDN